MGFGASKELGYEHAPLTPHISAGQTSIEELLAERIALRERVQQLEDKLNRQVTDANGDSHQAPDATLVKSVHERSAADTQQTDYKEVRINLKNLLQHNKQQSIQLQLLRDERSTMLTERNHLQLQVGQLKDELSTFKKVTEETQQRQQNELQREVIQQPRDIQDWQDTLSETQTSQTHYSILQRSYSSLSEKIEAQRSAQKLFECNALTLKELQSIQSKRDEPVEAAERLLNIIMQGSSTVYGQFVNTVKETGQGRVYELIAMNTCQDIDAEFVHAKTIQQHYVFLLDTIDAKHSGLVRHLHSSDVLTSHELDTISSQLSSFTQNEKLLSVLSRKTSDQFDKFLDALDKTGQQHVRNYITGRQEDEAHDMVNGATPDENFESHDSIKHQLDKAYETIDRLLQQLQSPNLHTEDSIHDDPYLKQPKLLKSEVLDGLTVVGVAVLDDVMYVVCSGSPKIRRYSVDPHSSLNESVIEINGMTSPTDIVASAEDHRLYVAGSSLQGDGGIWRVHKNHSYAKWLPCEANPKPVNPNKLSVNSNGVLITLWEPKLRLYDANGNLLCKVKLLDYVKMLHHAAETTRATICISHQGLPENRQLQNAVSEVNRNGVMLATFTQVDGPFHYVLIDREDNVFVSDNSQHRILLLNQQLKQRRVFLENNNPQGTQLWTPDRLALHHHERRTRLVVTHNDRRDTPSRSVISLFDIQ